MAKTFINRLSARTVSTAKPGWHADGGGLYLKVTASGTRSWVFRYARGFKTSASGRPRPNTRDMGLGPVHTISLAQARESALAARQLLLTGQDPLSQRKATLNAATEIPFFENAAKTFIEGQKSAWSNTKHADQWMNTLTTYAFPTIGKKRVDMIDVDDVLVVLTPIWKTKTETASRVRQRIEAVIDAVIVKHKLKILNPAKWKGYLDKILPNPKDVTPVKHHPAMPYKEVPAFMKELQTNPSVSARALELTIRGAARTSMTLGADRPEVHKHGEFGPLWTVPKERMKGRRRKKAPHDIPLTPAMLRVIEQVPQEKDNPAIFPGDANLHLSNNAMDALLEGMGYAHFTVHGFRATFKTWASEKTNIAKEISESVLAHTIKDKAEAAYQRGEMIERRRELLEIWNDYLDGKTITSPLYRASASPPKSKRRSRTQAIAKTPQA